MKNEITVSYNTCDYGFEQQSFSDFDTAIKFVNEIRANNKQSDISVTISDGCYKTSGAVLEDTDFHDKGRLTFKAIGKERPIINSGVFIDGNAFEKITDCDVLKRLSEDARENVKVFDLKKEGVTGETLGGIYAIGGFNLGFKYKNGVGNNCDLFLDGKRLSLARYPDDGFVTIQDVIEPGDCYEYPAGTYYYEKFDATENPHGGTVLLDDETIEHISHWKFREDIWTFGYYYHEWADSSSPISKIDVENKAVSFVQSSKYAYRRNGKFYFYNVFEELKKEGQYYIDRDTMLLYCYKPEKNGRYLLSLSEKPIISGSSSNITFEGIDFCGARNTGIILSGNGIRLENCRVYECAGNAIELEGENNVVDNCEVFHLGKGGIALSGGDRATLRNGNNSIQNCYIHNFGEVFMTYQPGAMVNGCGNSIIHNELTASPQMAIRFYGNEHTIEYNYLHDICYNTDDGGALYVGRMLGSYGNKIRFNYFENICGDGRDPECVYLDDGWAGCTVYGNIMKNCSGMGIEAGSGRDNALENNLFIDNAMGIQFDARYYNATRSGEKDELFKKVRDMGELWRSLEIMPYNTDEEWIRRYPELAKVHCDFDRRWDADFFAIPSHSTVKNNIFVNCGVGLRADNVVCKFGEVANNAETKETVYDDSFKIDLNFAKKNGVDWKQIPFEKIGRNK